MLSTGTRPIRYADIHRPKRHGPEAGGGAFGAFSGLHETFARKAKTHLKPRCLTTWVVHTVSCHHRT